MVYEYIPHGVCSSKITIEIENGVIKNVGFTGGCNGNLKGISSLVKGLKPSEVIEKLDNIKCGYKNTSCPDQLAKALTEISKN